MNKCVVCKKELKEKEKVIINYAPFCRKCADKRAKRIKESNKRDKAREEKEFEKRVVKIIEKWWKTKGKTN